MSWRRTLWLAIPEPLRLVPADLLATVVFVVAVNLVVFVPVLNETPLRVPLGLVFVLFIPGYALIAALFPEQGESPTVEDDAELGAEGWLAGRQRSGIDGIERVALSFGLSIAVVPLIGLALNFTPWGIRLAPIMVATSVFVLVMAAVATYRRWQLPAEERFAVPYRGWYERACAEVFEPDDRLDAALNVALALSMLLAVGALGFVVMFPPTGEQFSALYLLTEDDDGELVAANYPTEFVVGESQPIVVGVDNNEHSVENYTLVIQVQREEFVDNESVILEIEELQRQEFTLAHDETWMETVDIALELIGEDLRLQFLLYMDGEVPDQPRADTAYRDAHLWITVGED